MGFNRFVKELEISRQAVAEYRLTVMLIIGRTSRSYFKRTSHLGYAAAW